MSSYSKLHKKIGAKTMSAIGHDVVDHYCTRVTTHFFEKHPSLLFKKHLRIKTGKHFKSLRKAIVYAGIVRGRLGKETLEFMDNIGIRYI